MCFRLCACFSDENGKKILLSWDGGASDLRFTCFVVFLASCSLFVPVNNQSLFFSSFVFFVFFWSERSYIRGSFLFFFLFF